MLDCIVYVSSVLNPKKHPRKTNCLESFASGVKALGYSIRTEWECQYQPSKLAVILGWATHNTGGQNIALRKQIIQEQQALGLHTMCIDASCWKYLDKDSSYLRYSLGGPFYDQAEYANHKSTDEKWLEIGQALGITLDPIQQSDNGHILICMQRNGGFAMKNLNPIHWLQGKISQIRQITNRKIKVRPHPGAYYIEEFLGVPELENYDIDLIDPTTRSLGEDLQNAHAAIFFNSSASVAAVCAGIPIFVDDASCVAWAVANTDINNIETPAVFQREQWLYDLAAAHWTDADAKSGRIYQKFLPYLT